MKVHTAFLAAFAAGFAASGTAEARRMSAESAAALPPSSLVSAFCAVGGFDYLIRANNFEALRDLALWCPGGHATAAHALAESGSAPGSDRDPSSVLPRGVRSGSVTWAPFGGLRPGPYTGVDRLWLACALTLFGKFGPASAKSASVRHSLAGFDQM